MERERESNAGIKDSAFFFFCLLFFVFFLFWRMMATVSNLLDITRYGRICLFLNYPSFSYFLIPS